MNKSLSILICILLAIFQNFPGVLAKYGLNENRALLELEETYLEKVEPQEEAIPKVQAPPISTPATPEGPTTQCLKGGFTTKPTATNPELQKVINELFRSTDVIPGGTAGAVKHQLKTGELVGGRDHVIKAQERIRNLRNILRKENLSSTDKAMAECLIEDLTRALAED